MSYLFEVTNNRAVPNTETLLISPFKEIWERDLSQDKGTALKEFTYIELMSSKKRSNPYAGYEKEDRKKKLISMLFEPNWTPDSLIELGLEKIHLFQTEASVTYSYYMAVLDGVEKMKAFFSALNLNERNSKNVPLYKPNEIILAISNTDKVLQNLTSMKEKVEQELFDSVKTRSNKQINRFEI